MRKFLWVMAVGFLVLAMAAPAMALDFKFGAEYRVRFYDGTNVPNGFPAALAAAGQNFGTNPRGVQLRLRPRFDVSDDNGNITATWRAEIGDVEFGNGGGASGPANSGFTAVSPGGARVGNGAGGSMGLDGVNVETKWAFVDFALPFDIPARVRAGLQAWYLPKGIIMDDDAAGVRAYGKIAPVSYELAWYRVNGGPLSGAVQTINVGGAGAVTFTGAGLPIAAGTSNLYDNNYDFYGGKIDVAFAPWLNPGVYYFYGDNRVNCTVSGASATINAAGVTTAPVSCPSRARENHYVGVTATGKIGIVSYDLDWVFGSAEGGPTGAFGNAAGANPGGAAGNPITTKGWTLDGAVHFPIGPVTVNLTGSYSTGDQDNGGNSEAFPTIAPSWNGAGGGYELIGSGGPFDAIEFTQEAPTNLWMIGGWLEYRPVKALWLKLAYGYAGFARKSGNCANSVTPATCFGPSYQSLRGKSALGHELSFRADWDLWTGFKLQGQIGWLFTPADSNSTAGEYVLQMLYNF